MALLTTAFMTVCVHVCLINVCVSGSRFGIFSFAIVTLLKVFVLLDGDTEEAKTEST